MFYHALYELGKKYIHILLLLFLFFYDAVFNNFGRQYAMLTLTAVLIVLLVLEYFRLELNWDVLIFPFLRAKERENISGAVYFSLGAVISVAVFDFRIAVAALLMITFGDMISNLVGKRYGTTLLFRDKTIVACLTEFFVNLLIALIVLINVYNIYVIIGMSLVATITEIMADEIDENLLVPLLSGFVGQMLVILL